MHDSRYTLAMSWIAAAQIDLEAAQVLQERLPPPACFHAQQAAEKALNAALVFLTGDSPRFHVIHQLIEEVGALGRPIPLELHRDLLPLDQYYLPTRYPDALGGGSAMSTYSARQAQAAVEVAQQLLAWVAEIVRLP